MVTCQKCHSSFRHRINRLGTSFSVWPSVSVIDAYFNEAAEVWLRTKIAVRETDDLVRNDLRQLEVKNKELVLECFDGFYTADLPADYYSSLNYSVKATKEGCEECGKTLIAITVQSDDLQESLKDPFRKPSYEYEEVLVDEVGNSMVLYTNGEFDIVEVLLNYYRKITPLACPSLVRDKRFYVDPNGQKIDADVNFEIYSTYAYSDIIDIAVMLFLRDVSDNVEFDSQLKKMSVKYKLVQ